MDINKAWRFHRGDGNGFAEPDFDDSGWREVSLPHDWSIEDVPGTNSPFHPTLSEGKEAMGWSVGGTGWYRTTVELNPALRHTLVLDGALFGAELYVNGVKAGEQPYGYLPLAADLDPFLTGSGPQCIAVKVANEGHTSRWYTGSGITRLAELISTGPCRVEPMSLWVETLSADAEAARLKVRATLDLPQAFQGTMLVFLGDGEGAPLLAQDIAIDLPPGRHPVEQEVELAQPRLWNPWTHLPEDEEPAEYTAGLGLNQSSGPELAMVRFGIRTIQVSAESGLLINGQRVDLRGGCIHHDLGILGAAAHPEAEWRKAALLRDNGYNAVRTAHNPPSTHFLRACDSLGILVLDEIHDEWFEPKVPNGCHKSFPEWGCKNAALMVRRDREHACVFAWSIGNEIFGCFGQPETAKALRDAILAEDSSRPVAAGICAPFWNQPGWVDWETSSEPAYRHLEIGGYNYLPDKQKSDHASHPERPNFSTESYSLAMEVHWKMVEECSWVLGDFVWTAMDYIGESGIGQRWVSLGEPINGAFPDHVAVCGEIDLIGVSKPQAALRRAVWGESGVIEIAVHRPASAKRHCLDGNGWHFRWGWDDVESHWNWAPAEGELLKVEVYTSARKVQLMLNRQVVGEQELPEGAHRAVFEVAYEPGQLAAIGQEEDGEIAAMLETAKAPAGLDFFECPMPDQKGLCFFVLEVVDEAGVRVPGARPLIRFESGDGARLIAMGNASATDVDSVQDAVHRAWDGRLLAVVDRQDESASLAFHSEGLASLNWP